MVSKNTAKVIGNKVPTNNPLFILGFPRSGTTLLRALLGQHPEVVLVNEPELVRGIISSGYKPGDKIKPNDISALIQHLESIGLCQRHLKTLPFEIFPKLLASSKDFSFREMYEKLLPKPLDVPIWGEKSLSNVFYIQELHELYPNALFVFIIRDPRATLLSYYKKKTLSNAIPFNRSNIRFFAVNVLHWLSWVRAAEEAVPKLGDKNLVWIKYEDLVTSPESIVCSITNLLGLAFIPSMLNPAKRSHDPVLKSDAAYAHHKLSQPIDPGRVHAYKDLPNWACFIVPPQTEMEKRQPCYSTQNRRP